jgi:hypothetical protein
LQAISATSTDPKRRCVIEQVFDPGNFLAFFVYEKSS